MRRDPVKRSQRAAVHANDTHILPGPLYTGAGPLKRSHIWNDGQLFDAAVGAFGGVDIAINTVGKVLRKPIVETTEAEYDSMFDINAKAAYFFLQQAGRRLNDGGSVITIVTALLAAFTDGYSTYAGAKSPVEHFTRAAAKEFAARGINVNNVGPGPMDTPFFYGDLDADFRSPRRHLALSGPQ